MPAYTSPPQAAKLANVPIDINTFFNRDGENEKTIINKGGACIYSLIPASLFNQVGVVTRIGNDFDKELFNYSNFDTLGLKIVDGPSTKFIHTYLSLDGQTRTFKAEVNEECMIKIEDIPKEYLDIYNLIAKKPIDINEPFPNGLNNISLWYDWDKSKKKEPDISKSYNEITYYANTSGNEEKIRKYNNQNDKDSRKKDHPYASWEEMNINGTSQFIKNQGIVASNAKPNSFYNLGCGPKNTNVKDVFAQPECDRK